MIDIEHGVPFGSPVNRPLGQDAYPGSRHGGGIDWPAKSSTIEDGLSHCSTCQKLAMIRVVTTRSFRKMISEMRRERQISTHILAFQMCISLSNVLETERHADGVLGRSVRCFFSGTSTSHVYHHRDVMPSKIIVSTLLEGRARMLATGRIFGEGRLDWVRKLQGWSSRQSRFNDLTGAELFLDKGHGLV